MRTQIWIIAAAFIIFGAVAWLFTTWSPSYLGLIGMGAIMVVIGWFGPK